jgi:hypothetical protein
MGFGPFTVHNLIQSFNLALFSSLIVFLPFYIFSLFLTSISKSEYFALHYLTNVTTYHDPFILRPSKISQEYRHVQACHCEEQSDKAISLDCNCLEIASLSLAMTHPGNINLEDDVAGPQKM